MIGVQDQVIQVQVRGIVDQSQRPPQEWIRTIPCEYFSMFGNRLANHSS